MVILVGACLAAVVAVVLLVLSFLNRGREFTRPLGIFAVVWALALFLLYAIQ